jgi:hypothetical protein
MEVKYSFRKGLAKGLLSVVSILGAFIAFTSFSDVSMWDLMVQYIKPLLGGITVGGAITVLINYLKVRTQ